MGVKLSWSAYRRVYQFVTAPDRLVSVDRYTQVWEKYLLGDPVQFIHKYTEPDRLLVIIGERIIKKLLGL